MPKAKKLNKKLQFFVVLLSVCALVAIAGCTINFKAKELQLDSVPIKPNAGFSQAFELESFQVYTNGSEV